MSESAPRPAVSVIVPTYNERDNITPMITAALELLPKAEIIVVDDDSPDGTAREVESSWSHDPRVRLLRRMDERGLASALADGVAAARGERVAWLDADFNMEPSFLRALLEALDTADVAVASRYVPGGGDARASRLRVWGSVAANLVARALLGGQVRDYTSGLMAARREVFERVPLRRDCRHGDYCIDFLYRAYRAGMRVRELPSWCLERRSGETKTAGSLGQYASLSLAYLRTMLRLRLRGE